MPYLCLVCHGGTVNAANKAEFSRFREFDLPSFRYSANRQWAHSGANNNSLNNTELTAFTRLNQMVRGTTVGMPIGRLIDAWYTTGFAGAKKPVLPAPPPAWGGSPGGYHEVYGTACRACHLARDEGNGDAAYFVFADQANFANTSYIVCGANRKMPNAVVTYKNFWASTSRVSQFEALTGISNGTCKN